MIPDASAAEIARIHGLNPRSVSRHRLLHLSKLIQAAEAERHTKSELERGGDLLEVAEDYERRAVQILTSAEGTHNHDTALKAIKVALDCLRLRGELSGKMKTATTVNVFADVRWLTIQTGIVEALSAFPQAREAVVGFLSEAVN
ncbi:hypothetical protein [Lichenicoccus sp.]|uniref:hypothetical protein n=1 Tax=Lichenicoccus sp. TaxID=2781899 RepID=UPI003D13CBB8